MRAALGARRSSPNRMGASNWRACYRNQKLSGVLPLAMKDPAARDQLLAIGTDKALEWYTKLDDRDRAEQKAEVAEAVEGIRWADTPEKWAQAKAYWQRKGMDVPDLPFEAREQVAMELGGIAEYMESAPKLEWKTVEAGGAGGTFDPRSGQFTPVIAPNPGDQPFGAPATGGGAVPPPPPGFVVNGGPASQAPGTFPR